MVAPVLQFPKLCMVGMIQDEPEAMMTEGGLSAEDCKVEIVAMDQQMEPDLLHLLEEIESPSGSKMKEGVTVTTGEIEVTPQGHERTSTRGRGITRATPTKIQGRKGGIDSKSRVKFLLVRFVYFQPYLCLQDNGKDQDTANLHLRLTRFRLLFNKPVGKV